MFEYLSELDKAYNKKRNNKEIAITHRNKPKAALTEDDELIIKRNRYKDRKSNQPFYYLDNIINLDRRQRITDSFQSEILKTVIDKSYKYTEKKNDKENSLISFTGIIFAFSLAIFNAFDKFDVANLSHKLQIKYYLIIVFSIFYFISFAIDLAF